MAIGPIDRTVKPAATDVVVCQAAEVLSVTVLRPAVFAA